MAQVASNVRIDKPSTAGAVWVAAVGTPLPATPSVALNAAFKTCGYLMSDGLSRDVTRDTSEIVAWGGDVVAIAETKDAATFQFTMIETNDVSLGLFHADTNVSTVGGITTVHGNATPFPHYAAVVDTLSGAQRGRVVFGDVKVSARGSIVHQDKDATARQVTLTAFPSAAIGGDKWLEYIETAGVAGVPALFSVTPGTAVAAGSTMNVIYGTNFTGTTAVTLGGVNAPNFQVITDTRIAFDTPAVTAGSKPIVVTNGAGPSITTLNIVVT